MKLFKKLTALFAAGAALCAFSASASATVSFFAGRVPDSPDDFKISLEATDEKEIPDSIGFYIETEGLKYVSCEANEELIGDFYPLNGNPKNGFELVRKNNIDFTHPAIHTDDKLGVVNYKITAEPGADIVVSIKGVDDESRKAMGMNVKLVFKAPEKKPDEGEKPVVGDLKGDYNGDGKVTAKDASFLLKLIASGNKDAKFDFNGDGKTNAKDASAILKHIVSKN